MFFCVIYLILSFKHKARVGENNSATGAGLFVGFNDKKLLLALEFSGSTKALDGNVTYTDIHNTDVQVYQRE